MSAEPVDQTRLTAIPAQPPESDGDQMNGFEVAVNFFLYWLPAACYVAMSVLTVAAGAIELFIEIGPWLSVLITVAAVLLAIYGGTRFRRLPLVPLVVPRKAGSRG